MAFTVLNEVIAKSPAGDERKKCQGRDVLQIPWGGKERERKRRGRFTFFGEKKKGQKARKGGEKVPKEGSFI